LEAIAEGLERLATILFPSRFTGKRLLLMLAAYFDESGAHSDSPIIAVADFSHRKSDGLSTRQNGLTSWKVGSVWFPYGRLETAGAVCDLSEPERIELLASLIEIIATTAWVGISAALVKADYAAICEAERVTFGSEYALCANDGIRLLNKWLDERHIRERVAYMYELGAPGPPIYIEPLTTRTPLIRIATTCRACISSARLNMHNFKLLTFSHMKHRSRFCVRSAVIRGN